MKRELKRRHSFVLLMIVIVFSISLAIFSSISLVSAQVPFLDDFIQKAGDTFGSIFAPIFGVSTFDEFLFAKILLFFLLFAIIFMVLKRITIFEGNITIISVVAVIVSLFAVRFIKENEFINAILLPYGTLGVSISIFLPLLIFFYFLHDSEIGGFGRRAAWFIYGAVFLVLWVTRPYDSLGAANWIYILGLGFVIISFIFDRSIHRYFTRSGYEEAAEEVRQRAIAEDIEQLRLAEEQGNTARARRIRARLRNRGVRI